MDITITINTDNAAFHGEDDDDTTAIGPEVARILRHLAQEVYNEPIEVGDTYPLRDLNGNIVGKVVVTA